MKIFFTNLYFKLINSKFYSYWGKNAIFDIVTTPVRIIVLLFLMGLIVYYKFNESIISVQNLFLIKVSIFLILFIWFFILFFFDQKFFSEAFKNNKSLKLYKVILYIFYFLIFLYFIWKIIGLF